MFKEYLAVLLVLIALDYSIANTDDCPHPTFNSYHRCKKYDAKAKERECTYDELVEQAKASSKKLTGTDDPRAAHTLFYYTNSEQFTKSGDRCTAKNYLHKHSCYKWHSGTWTCEVQNNARPIHRTTNGHYIGDA